MEKSTVVPIDCLERRCDTAAGQCKHEDCGKRNVGIVAGTAANQWRAIGVTALTLLSITLAFLVLSYSFEPFTAIKMPTASKAAGLLTHGGRVARLGWR